MARERDDEPVTHSVFMSTHAVMFFATPHRGLLADDILNVLNPESDADRIRLVNSINSNSGWLTEETLRTLLNRGASITATGAGSQTALHLAASGGHEEAVKFLLES